MLIINLIFIFTFLINWGIVFILTQSIWSTGNYPGDLVVFVTSLLITVVIIGISLSPIGEKLTVKLNGGRQPTQEEQNYIEPFLREVALKTNMPQPNLYVSNSAEINAYAVGKNSIILNLGLLNTLPPAELCAVIAHELGHLYYKDTIRVDLIFVVIRISKWITRGLLAATGVGMLLGRNFVFLVPLLIFSLIMEWFYAIVEKIVSFIVLFISRQKELRADRFAVEYGFREGLASFIERTAPYQNNTGTHPSVKKRLKNI